MYRPAGAMAPSTASSAAASYADCVSSLRTSLQFLESSVQTLDSGVSDFPRLVKVLKTVRVRLLDRNRERRREQR